MRRKVITGGEGGERDSKETGQIGIGGWTQKTEKKGEIGWRQSKEEMREIGGKKEVRIRDDRRRRRKLGQTQEAKDGDKRHNGDTGNKGETAGRQGGQLAPPGKWFIRKLGGGAISNLDNQ